MGTPLNFDANAVSPTSTFEPIPNGTYRMHIVESEVKPTKDGRGRYLQLVWEVLDGEFKGRKVWDRLNIQNPNATAQEIAQRALSAICHACGVLRLSNSAQLHHIPAMVKVVVKQDAGYEPRNDVKKYEACADGPGVAVPKSGTTAHGGEQAGNMVGAGVSGGTGVMSSIHPASSSAPPAASPPAWAKKPAA